MTTTVTRPLYQIIAARVQAVLNCRAMNNNNEWEQRHLDVIKYLVETRLPSGSGIDTGTHFYDEDLNPERLQFNLSYHHMDDGGGYAGWTDHVVIVTPSLASGFNIRVTGRDRNGIKEYLAETYAAALGQMVGADAIP